jgi:tRNA threonylcarbamoyladenosine biosynthesis protein TsaE
VTRDEVEYRSRSTEETRAAGRAVSALLAPGDLVLLSGPLGAGKTEFVRGLAEGLGAGGDEVASPTFALVHEHGGPLGTPVFVHADLYRLLGAAGEGRSIEDLGLEEARAGGAVVVVEWPEALDARSASFAVTIAPEDDGTRRISVRRVSGSRA